LCDVLEWSAKEACELLDLSVPAVNSALQRARATLREHQPARGRQVAAPEEKALVDRYIAASERCDMKALAALLRDDVRFSTPPEPSTFAGRENVLQSWVDGGYGSPGWTDWRFAVTRANRMPAVAGYLRKPGEAEYLPLAIDVLRVDDGRVAEVITFALSEPFLEAFDLPRAL